MPANDASDAATDDASDVSTDGSGAGTGDDSVVETDNGSIAETDDAATAGDELPDVTCTLTDSEVAQREAWMAEHLLPHLERIERTEEGYDFVFERTPAAYEAVTTIAWKEAQCCAWATFAVELPPGNGPLLWRERSGNDEGAELFGDALADLRERHPEIPAAEG